MAIQKPVSVPKKRVSSVDITGFSGGMYLNGEQNAKGNQIIEGENVKLSIDGFIENSDSLERWLPDTLNEGYQVYPVIWLNQMLYFTVDNNKVRWIADGGPAWADCGGANTVTTGPRIKPILIRVMNSLLIVNGGGNDRLAFVDLVTKNVIRYTFVSDPVIAPTAAPTVLTNSGGSRVYYGYTFSTATGETKLSPILTYTVNKSRDTWNINGTEFLTVSRPAGNPVGAISWNLYVALAPGGPTISSSDMLSLATGLDLATTALVDNSSIPIDIGRGNPPSVNATDGPRCRHAIETNGRPVLFGDIDNPENIWIGGDGDYARDFSSSNGGFRSTPSKGTNYYPASVVGFRTGQGAPSLTILFSNTEGLSKQAVLEQQTVRYGNQSFVVWGVTEQNYGAAGVASSFGVVNYKGELAFPSTDGMMSMDTLPQLQNVLESKNIDNDVKEYFKRVKTSALPEIVGAAWNNLFMWIIPSNGFDTPQEIAVRDMNNNGAWYFLKIKADWIGVVSPPNSPAFVYIRQGRRIARLFSTLGTVNYHTGVPETFATSARGALIGMNEARNGYFAVAQAVFYLRGFIGSMTIGVRYRNRLGRMKTKERVLIGPQYVVSSSGGYSDPMNTYAGFPGLLGYSASAKIVVGANLLESVDVREPVRIRDLMSEAQWYFRTPSGYNKYQLRVVSYEGENLGVKPGIR